MRFVVPFNSKTIISTIAFAALTSLTLVQATAPSVARDMNTCALRQSFCNERCIMSSNEGSAISACIQRTCNNQFNNCMKDASTREGRTRTDGPAAAGRVAAERRRISRTRNLVATPPNGGILGGDLVPAGQSPAATGTPITRSHNTPNTPVIIR